MKKIVLYLVCAFAVVTMTGCAETVSSDEQGNITREFTVGQNAIVNNTEIKINSIKKILKECSWEYDGVCQSYTEPENNYFLLIDLTINNKGSEDLSVSSMMSFNLKDTNGEQGQYSFLTNSIKSQLDGTVMSNDMLKGQIAFDVKESDKYYFYYSDSLLDSPIKFVINSNDITE